MVQSCPECGATWRGNTCQDDFHQMLFWEAENPALSEVHHLMVLCYHLQHPSLYSPEGLAEARQLLIEFVEHGRSPAEIRRRNRARLDSSQRNWKIKGTPAAQGSYDAPIQWTMTAADVIAGGSNSYCDNVRAWAQSIQANLAVHSDSS
ncbi:MAG TPA: DUF5946 family protein [Anaerolineae bacterium]